jgi:putative sigma-54 modulation protein
VANDVETKKIINNMNLNVHAVHFTADEKLVDLVKSKSEKLNHFYDKITSVDVYLKLDNNSEHIKDKTVEIKVNALHDQIFTKETSKTFEESLSGAIDSTIAKLKKKKESVRG